MSRYTTATLRAFTVIPALGIIINIIWPTPNAYFQEQGLLFITALSALLLSKTTPAGAIFLYFTFALFPVGAMLEHYQSIGGGWSALMLIPLFGILFVGFLIRNKRAVVLYGVIAIVASIAYCGLVCCDVGQAGAMLILDAGFTALACGAIHVFDKANNECQHAKHQYYKLSNFVEKEAAGEL